MKTFSGSLRSLVHHVNIGLKRNEINAGLSKIHHFVERIITEPICTSQVLGSRVLDDLCLQIGRQNLASVSASNVQLIPPLTGRISVVYLVSRLQRSGGHSRLVQDFIRCQPEKNHLIISTEVCGRSDKNFFSEIFNANPKVRCIYAPKGNLESKLTWLQSILLMICPEHLYLFNHHQDSTAVSALVPELGIEASFVHHGDHHLSLGVHMSHLAHVDLHPMGYHYCRDDLGIDNTYLPLTFEDKGFVSDYSNGRYSEGLTTATAAGSNKIEIPYYVSYLDTIPRILKITGGRHIHIGRLTPWALRRIYSQMHIQGVNKQQFVYIEWVPSVWKALQENKVDVYIASFPYGAGLTLIEAMGAGIPVIMHQHLYSRVLSGLELAYPAAYNWSVPEKLLEYLQGLNSEQLKQESFLSRQRYEKFHKPEILIQYLKDPGSLSLSVPALDKRFRPRPDEWAAWAESQICFSSLLYRLAYRLGRRVRAFISQRVIW